MSLMESVEAVLLVNPNLELFGPMTGWLDYQMIYFKTIRRIKVPAPAALHNHLYRVVIYLTDR